MWNNINEVRRDQHYEHTATDPKTHFPFKKALIHDRALFTSKFNRVFSFVTYLHNEMLKQVTDIWIFITSAFK